VVRRSLRPWLGVAGFLILVGVLTFIALDRIEEPPSLEGRWELVVVETPEGSFHPEDGPEWIEFDGSTFRGHLDCIDFAGDFEIAGTDQFMLGDLRWNGGCGDMVGTGYGFEQYFYHVTLFRVETDLVIHRLDNSVQFIFTREGDSAAGWIRAL
jgi:hypothetical protein